MPSPSSAPSPKQHDAPGLSFDQIAAPSVNKLPPDKRFELESSQEIAARKKDLFDRTYNYFTTGPGAAMSQFKEILTHNPHLMTKSQHDRKIGEFIQKVKDTTIPRQAPLFTSAELAAHPATSSLDLPTVAENIEKHFKPQLEEAIEAAIKQAMANAKEEVELERQKQIHKLCGILNKTGALTPAEMDAWIELASEDMSRHDRKRLAETGLVRLPAKTYADGVIDPKVEPSRKFNELRLAKFHSAVSAAVTVGVVVGAAVAVGTGFLPFSMSPVGLWGIATGVCLANWAWQKRCETYHKNVMKATWQELQSELKKVQTEGCAAWVGTLYKFIREANPIWIDKNQTDLFSNLFTPNPATTVDATLEHLKSAAIVALADKHKLEQWQRGQSYKDHLDLCKPNLTKLEARWNWWHDKQKMVAPYLAVGSATGAVMAWPSAIPKF